MIGGTHREPRAINLKWYRLSRRIAALPKLAPRPRCAVENDVKLNARALDSPKTALFDDFRRSLGVRWRCNPCLDALKYQGMHDRDVEDWAFEFPGDDTIVEIGLAVLQAGTQGSDQRFGGLVWATIRGQCGRRPSLRTLLAVRPRSCADGAAGECGLERERLAGRHGHISRLNIERGVIAGIKSILSAAVRSPGLANMPTSPIVETRNKPTARRSNYAHGTSF